MTTRTAAHSTGTPRRTGARAGAAVASALAASLVLTACGSDLRADRADADAALREAGAVSVTLRFDDPDGDLRRAAVEAEDGLPADVADLFLGGSLTVTVDRVGDGPLLGLSTDPTRPISEQVAAVNTAFTVRTGEDALLDLRLVDSVVYAASDLDRIEEIAAEQGGGSLDDALEGAPPAVVEAVEALRSGSSLSLPLGGFLEQADEALESFQGELDALEGPDTEQLLTDLQGAITPNVRLRDLGVDGGTREVEVGVDVKAALTSALDVFEGAYAEQLEGLAGVPLEETGDDVLAEVSDDPVTGTLTIEDGHYTALRVPLAELFALDATPDPDVPDFGTSALVIEVDDSPGDLQAPTDVYEIDLEALVADLFGSFTGGLEGLEGVEGLDGLDPLAPEGDLFSTCLEGDPLCTDESTGLDPLEGEVVDPFTAVTEGLTPEEVDALFADPEALDAALCEVDPFFC